MLKEYDREQLWKLYQKLPEELKEVIFSVGTANSIYDICERSGVKEVSKVTKLVGFVLLGVLSPEEFQESLKRELILKPDVAKKVSQEIDRFVLHSVRTSIANLYKTEGI